jgi:tetratricopeptide (TPR) repeat protein
MPVDGKWLARAAILTAVLLAGLYAWSLDNPVLASDGREVLENYYLGGPALAAKLFVDSPESMGDSFERYSPLATLSLAVNRSLWGGDPRGYRVTALVLHGLCTVVLFLLLVRFGVAELWALFAALVFAVHPIHTQTVNILAARGHIQSSLCALAAVYILAGALLREGKGAQLGRPAGSWAALGFFLASLLFGWEALIFVFAALLLPYSLGVSYPGWRFYVGIGTAAAVYVVLALIAGGPGSLLLSQGHWGAAALSKAMSLMLTIPAEQMVFHPLEYAYSWADGRALAALGFVLALAIVSVLLRKRRRGMSLALALTACAVPAYFFAAGNEGALMEPGLYVLAGSLFVVVGAGAELLDRMRGARPVVVVVMALLLGAAFVTAAGRNSVWSDEERVWKEVLEAYPNSGLAKKELADYYRATGRAAEAAELATTEAGGELARAIELNNEGVAMRDLGRLGEAMARFREAIEIWPDFRDAHFNLGVVYHNMRMNDSALVSLRRAASIDPTNADTRYNLGIVYDAMGNAALAEVEYREAVAIDERHARAWANLGSLLGKKGDFQGAISALDRAIRIDPGLLQARYNRALAYESVDVEMAREEWRDFLSLARRKGIDPARINQIERRLEDLER